MKREIFRRGVRMTHRFGELEGLNDPFSSGTFDPGFPISPSKRRSRSLEVKKDGEYRYCDPQSPIVNQKTGKPASLNGPAPDYSDLPAQTMPLGTVKRKVP